MTIYTWGQQAPLEKMEVQPFGKGAQAVLHARAGADSAQLFSMREMLHAQGFAAIPEEVDGKPVLVVRGFANDKDVAAALEQNNFVNAQERQTQKTEQKKDKTNFVDKVRASSFKLSGYVYMIGDAALAVSGLKRGDTNETFSGLAYGATSVVAARYGERKPEHVFEDLYSKMLNEFAKDGVELPKGEELTAKELGKTGGLVHRIEKFLYDYPTQILTAGNAIAGFNLFRAGMNQGSNDKRIAGVLVTTGMLVGLLVPEKAKKAEPKKLEDIAANVQQGADASQVWVQPEAEKPGGVMGMLTSARDWVQEKPLRVGGYMAMGNNFFMAKGALAEKQANPMQREYLQHLKNGNVGAAEALKGDMQKKITKAEFNELSMLDPSVDVDHRTMDAKLEKLNKADGMWKMNMVAAASYMVANGLLSISSTKGGQEGGKDKDGNEIKDPNSELYAAAAAIIANQPQEVQDQAISKMAVFLAEQKEISLTPDVLAEKMREKVASVKDNPWLDPAKHGSKSTALPRTDVPRYADQQAQQAGNAAWVEKEAARASATQEAGHSGASR